MARDYDAETIERKWLQRWQEAGVERAQRGNAGDPKFFIHFAYPGISGYLHVGHLRGFTYADVFARYKRMTGHRVLFPAGFHASGIPSVGLARRVERQEPATIEYLRANGCPEDVIPTLKDPLKVVEYFSQVYTDDYWRRFGYLIDWRTLCTTIDPGYMRFIQWQFRRLKDAGLLTQKPHFGPFCPIDGAVAVDASETDISRGGGAEVKEFTNVLFSTDDGLVLPAATLRPETVYGVTNLWLHPEGRYVEVDVGGARWVLGADSVEKIRQQRDDVGATTRPLATQDLLAMKAINPLTKAKVPILAGTFVDPGRGTGLVMSVPAHAPYDWQALKDLGMPVEPIVIIDIPGAKGVPAETAARAHGAQSQADAKALDAATDDVYKSEFHKGVMNARCGPFAGQSVRAAKDAVKALLKQTADGGTTYEFSEPVVCRCGQSVVIRRIPDQWFIRYSDAETTTRSQEHAKTMNVYPEEYKRDLPSVLDWFGDRACIRRGSWLGTSYPYDEEWIIEPISDSTFYSAYYVVSPYVNDGRLKPEELTDEFFDHVILAKGKARTPVWSEARKDFEFWYPVDINLGGKEHKTVHFPPYIMNHIALVGPKLAPRGIFVNWWVTQKAGEKISKSKGGAEPIPGAAKKYTVDGMRLYYCNVASAHVDIEWDPDVVINNRNRAERIHQLVTDMLDDPSTESPAAVDAWLEAAWRRRLQTAKAAFEAFDTRTATTELYYEFYNDLTWHRRRGGRASSRVRDVLKAWVRALAPVTPFLAEEVWSRFGESTLVTTSEFPQPEGEPSQQAIAHEQLVRSVLEDLVAIRNMTKMDPKAVHVYTAPEWKRRVAAMVAEHASKGSRDPGPIIKACLADPALKAHAKLVPAFVQKTMKEMQGRVVTGALDGEHQVLSSAAGFLAKELAGAEVHVWSADDADAPDPGGKKAAANPGKPAIYMA
jgi:leucyl-tRNA synthetase